MFSMLRYFRSPKKNHSAVNDSRAQHFKTKKSAPDTF